MDEQPDMTNAIRHFSRIGERVSSVCSWSTI